MWIDYVLDTMENIVAALVEVLDSALTLAWFLIKAITGVFLMLTVPLWIIPYQIWDNKNRNKNVNKNVNKNG